MGSQSESFTEASELVTEFLGDPLKDDPLEDPDECIHSLKLAKASSMGASLEATFHPGPLNAGLVVLLVELIIEPLAVVLPGDIEGASLLPVDAVSLRSLLQPGISSELARSRSGTKEASKSLARPHTLLSARRSVHPRAAASKCSRKDTLWTRSK